MDRIPPYDYATYVFAARAAVITCSIFELLQIFGSLEESSFFAKFFYFLFSAASASASAYNIAMSTDGRDEIRKVVGNPDCETRGISAACKLFETILLILICLFSVVLAPALAGILLFISVSGNALISFFVLIHVLISIAQLGTEAYETVFRSGTSCNPYSQPKNPSCGAPITSERKPFTEPLKPAKTDEKAKSQGPVVQEPIYHTLERVKNEAEKLQ
ncbi:hypothetical protein CAEBREN_11503 [Caenorhabditis brenneri]|uniref:DUF7087 domain-containing protein n=1 Tax=Caenorhabditis brenneri TaxID=135651 RepID=G0PDS9_CAEBE|nr:hypothetical protein CAEBREN_11503 [Caenorhabditis brenneri]